MRGIRNSFTVHLNKSDDITNAFIGRLDLSYSGENKSVHVLFRHSNIGNYMNMLQWYH